MSAARHKITLAFDVVSPWARVAVTTLRRYRGPWNMDLDLHPINLGYVMKFAANKPPITIPGKGIWMNEDMERASRFFNVTLNRPANFPVNTFFAMSLLRLIKLEHADKYEAAVDAFYDAVWSNDLAVAEPKVLGEVLLKAKIFTQQEDVQKLVERAISKEEKGALAKESQQLVEEGGCFGAPWIVVQRKSDGETARFFGSDRTEQIAAFLHEEYLGPLADGKMARL